MGMLDKIRGQANAPSGAHQHSHDDAHVHEGADGAVHDPVCNMWVDPKKAPARSEYKGQVVYFCSPGCKKAFDANPEKYAAKLRAS